MRIDVPEEHRTAAEEVRAHLVSLRGGAPFLSSRDALLLMEWLDGGVEVSAIQQALERAVEARRKRPSRVPLSLTHAKRHLGKPGVVALEAPADEPGSSLSGLAAAIRAASDGDRHGPALREVAATLDGLDGDTEAIAVEAVRSFRRFFDIAWEALGAERDAWIEAGIAELGDVVEILDEDAARQAGEEVARDRLRRGYPLLTVATVREWVR